GRSAREHDQRSTYALRATVDNLRGISELAGLPTEARSRIRRAKVGGEAGIRTLGRSLSLYNGLANRRLRPLGHLTAQLQVYVTQALTRKPSMAKGTRRVAFKPSPLPLSATTPVGCSRPTPLVLG